MGALIVSLGGGGGASSDECTATANDILKGTRTINRNSDDEIVEGKLELTGNAQAAHVLENETFYTNDAHSQQKGTMKNIGSIDGAKSVTMSGEYMYVRMSPGAHITNASSGYPEVSIPQSSIASALGVNANNMLAGTSIAGVSGNITNRGSWTGSVNTNGTTYIPAGYHNGSGYMKNSQATMNGGTYTPSTSTQTVWCKGKLMTENITFNSIPSNYVNINGNADLFNNGSFGTIAGGAKTTSKRSGNYVFIYKGVVNNMMQWTRGSDKYAAATNGHDNIVFKKKIPFASYSYLEIEGYNSLGWARYYPTFCFGSNASAFVTDVYNNAATKIHYNGSGLCAYWTGSKWKWASNSYDYAEQMSGAINGHTIIRVNLSGINSTYYFGICFNYGYGASTGMSIGSEMDIGRITLIK